MAYRETKRSPCSTRSTPTHPSTKRYRGTTPTLMKTKPQPALPYPVVRCLTKHDAAQYLGIGVTLFDSLRIPCVRFGRRCVWDRVDLDAWLDKHKRAAARNDSDTRDDQRGACVDRRDAGRMAADARVAREYAAVLGLTRKEKR